MFFDSRDYNVSLKGRSRIIYSEGKRKAHIESEMLTGSTDLVIYFDRFRAWQSPFEKINVTDEDKQRIKRNISKELEGKGLVIEWE
ncbi:Imm74 family immunity protein [Nitrosomonas aestuarii]|uniref:Imm74 family immunity protein n=1 Tax=Nitrosomonas aestuarii TaxID=52441 RepID=UPI000D2FA0FC|nr:Imm74 family immunity protein [Nitrosomonas aestuarii]PTN12730.1 immunity protein 74 of polymorphic toxin system [Nitrosomonas aestuarii]